MARSTHWYLRALIAIVKALSLYALARLFARIVRFPTPKVPKK